jgi:hypothetical protein
MSDSEERVWIIQCLCPQRHCVFAGAFASHGTAEQLKEQEQKVLESLDGLISSGAINPWCAICRAKRETWRLETGKTSFRTLDEAMPALRLIEAKQKATALLLRNTQN